MNRVKLILWLGFFLRLVLAFYNGFVGPTYGSGDDALGFHFVAVDVSQDFVTDVFVLTYIYPYLLGIFYFITTDSLFWEALYLLRMACIRIYSPTNYEDLII